MRRPFLSDARLLLFAAEEFVSSSGDELPNTTGRCGRGGQDSPRLLCERRVSRARIEGGRGRSSFSAARLPRLMVPPPSL